MNTSAKTVTVTGAIENSVQENAEQKVPESKVTENAEKTFTKEEVNKLLTSRLAQEKAKNERVLAEKISEAEKLAQMSAEQQAAYRLEQLEKELAARETEIVKRELTAEMKLELSEKGLPTELAGCLDYSSEENCRKSLEAVLKAFSASVERAVGEKLRQPAPRYGAGKVTRDPFLEGIGT